METAGRTYKQVECFVHVADNINSIGVVTPEVNRGIGQAWQCFAKYSRAVYKNPYIVLPKYCTLHRILHFH